MEGPGGTEEQFMKTRDGGVVQCESATSSGTLRVKAAHEKLVAAQRFTTTLAVVNILVNKGPKAPANKTIARSVLDIHGHLLTHSLGKLIAGHLWTELECLVTALKQ